MLGRQVGRVVGVLQGARARADRFTQDNELRQLQNELRSSLRELDTVRGELAVAATGSGLMGKGLGTMVPGANRIGTGASSSETSTRSTSAPNTTSRSATSSVSTTGLDYLAAARSAEASVFTSSGGAGSVASGNPLGLAPRSQSVAAVAEEEWAKQGIGFVSRAERGTGAWAGMTASGSGGVGGGGGGSSASGQTAVGGAVLLSDVIQQSLIYDQHDRAVREQEEALAQRAERIRQEKLQQQGNRHDGGAASGSSDR